MDMSPRSQHRLSTLHVRFALLLSTIETACLSMPHNGDIDYTITVMRLDETDACNFTILKVGATTPHVDNDYDSLDELLDFFDENGIPDEGWYPIEPDNAE